MKKAKTFLAGVLLAASMGAPAFCYVIDGDVSDWGITPYSNWVPSSPTADRAGGDLNNELDFGGVDNTSPLADFGGPKFDVKALYLDNDSDYVYFALLTAFPQAGVVVDGIHYRPGDLAVGVFGNDYAFGLKASDLTPLGAAGEFYATSPGDWVLPHAANGFPANGPSEFQSGSFIGDLGSNFIYTELAGFPSNGVPTYVMEGAIPRSWLLSGGERVGANAAQMITMNWQMSCANDKISLDGTLDNPVPEPATVLLTGFGLAGAAFFRRKKAAAV